MRLFGKKKASPSAEIEQLVESFELPSFPTVINDALAALRDAQSTTKEVGSMLEKDPGISTRLLSTVNSAQFSMRQPVRSVQHAVQLLGRNEVETMLISVAVHQSLPSPQTAGFDGTRFWTTSAQRAAASAAIADRLDPSSRSESFTAALLQDMALPVLALHKVDYGKVLEAWHSSSHELPYVEREEYGWDHTEVAEHLCRKWDLPGRLQTSIARHHDQIDDLSDTLPGVHLVSVFREAQCDVGFDRFVELCKKVIDLPEDQAIDLVHTSLEESKAIAQAFC